MGEVIQFPKKSNEPKLTRAMRLLDQLIPYIKSNGTRRAGGGPKDSLWANFWACGQGFFAVLYTNNGKPCVEVWCETGGHKVFAATRAPFECWNLPTSAVLDDLLKAIHATNTAKSA